MLKKTTLQQEFNGEETTLEGFFITSETLLSCFLAGFNFSKCVEKNVEGTDLRKWIENQLKEKK